MKKLMVALLAALGITAMTNAATLTGDTGTTFTGLSLGYNLNTAHDDVVVNIEEAGEHKYWSYGNSDGLVDGAFVSNYVNYATEVTCGRPNQYSTAEQINYLSLDIDGTLYRYADDRVGGVKNIDIGDGLYFDSLVQFTATDTAPSAESEDKLIVWLKEDLDEDHDGANASTNLVITAGYLAAGNIPSAQNYVIPRTGDYGVEIVPGTWHRLTIKAIKDIGTSTCVAGFVVFIDGVAVSNTDAKGDAGTVLDSLNSTAQRWATANQLFPSMVQAYQDNDQEITAVGFKGTGAIDDLVFTTTAPDFATDGLYLTLTWDANVTAITYQIGSGAIQNVDMSGSNFAIPVGDAGNTYNVTVSATYATGYSDGTWLFNGIAASSHTVPVSAASTLEITSYRPVCKIGTDEYGSLAEAVDAISADGVAVTIELTENTSSSDILNIDAGKNVVIDLAGHTITGYNEYDAETNPYGGDVIDNFGTLTITNSTVALGHIVCANANVLIAIWTSADSVLNLTAGAIDGMIVAGEYDAEGGEAAPEINITGGQYVKSGNEEGDEFYLEAYLVSGHTAGTFGTPNAGYWTVVEGGEPPAVTYTVTFNNNAHGGVAPAAAQVAAGETVLEPAEPTDPAYTFTGWFTAPVNGDEWDFDNVVTESITLYAHWTQTTYHATYNMNGHGDQILPDNIYYGVKITKPTDPVAAGWVFSGWFTDSECTPGNEWDFDNDLPTGDITFYAKWIEDGGADWPATPSDYENQSAGDVFGITGPLANADACVLATWAKAKSVNYAERTTGIKAAAFLLNCDNDDSSIATAAANFKFTAITVSGSTATPMIGLLGDGDTYGNGKIVIKSKAALSDANWATDTVSPHFFKAFLEVIEVSLVK